MVASTPEAFATAVTAYRFGDVSLDSAMVRRATHALAASGLLLVGEPHGVSETPAVLYEIAVALGSRAIALEWSHDELDELATAFLDEGSSVFERFWSLPGESEFFAGDGRITAGHFALLGRLRAEGRLEQLVLFDRLDPDPPADWIVRDREMAERLLRVWDDRHPLLACTGAFHAHLGVAQGDTMAAHLAARRQALRPAMLAYGRGSGWSRGTVHDVSGPMPGASIVFRVPTATPAVVPGVNRESAP